MEAPWDRTTWVPTAVGNYAGMSSVEDIEQKFTRIRQETIKIKIAPYSPTNWVQRARLLLEIGYPELAAGDARKAWTLLEGMVHTDDPLFVHAREQLWEDVYGAGTRDLSSAHTKTRPDMSEDEWNKVVKVLHMKNFVTLAGALKDMSAYYAMNEVCKEARALYPDDDILQDGLRGSSQGLAAIQSYLCEILGPAEAEDKIKRGHDKDGMITYRRYPFMRLEELQRTPAFIESVNLKLRSKGSPCVLRASDVRSRNVEPTVEVLLENPTLNSNPERIVPGPDPLGLFATSTIEKGDVIFTDLASWGATTLPAAGAASIERKQYTRCENCLGAVHTKRLWKDKCCATMYCSFQCLKESIDTYHRVICGKDFTWLPELLENTSFSDNDPHLWLRTLAMLVQSGIHPLDHPLIAGLTANYESEVIREWSLDIQVDLCHKILKALGVDIFKDLRFDTWVLQTISARICNNARGNGMDSAFFGDQESSGVYPLFSFFNHSCEPSVEIEDLFVARSQFDAPVFANTIVVVAARKIEEGEEIFTSYIGSRNGDCTSVGERRDILRNWLSGDCQCTRCEKDSELARSATSGTS